MLYLWLTAQLLCMMGSNGTTESALKKFFLKPRADGSSFLVVRLKPTLFLKKGALSFDERFDSNLGLSFRRGDRRMYCCREMGAPVGKLIVFATQVDGL